MRLKTNSLLTVEEWRVAETIATGRTIKETAQHLCKSANTIVNQIQSIYGKVRIPHNLNALAVWYVSKKNNIDLPDFMRRCGALMLLALLTTQIALDVNGINARVRRIRRTRRNEVELIIEN